MNNQRKGKNRFNYPKNKYCLKVGSAVQSRTIKLKVKTELLPFILCINMDWININHRRNIGR